LYQISTLFAFTLKYTYSYRKKIIDTNLSYALPNKEATELLQIRNEYYEHLSDLIAETIKSISISEKDIKKRMKLSAESFALLRKYENTGQHIFVALGHYGNWEWASLLAGLETNLPATALYRSPSNKTFEQFILKNRSRFGCQLVAMHQLKTLYSNLQKGANFVAFVADQTPVDTEQAYWTNFMGLQTPFYKGIDGLARKNNAIVLYLSIQKVKRGTYVLKFETITEHAQQEEENMILEKYIRLLEKDIHMQPQYWLWSHRRWKRAGINY
jgi:KDO2-lipid IV(A) lauroyltransferase